MCEFEASTKLILGVTFNILSDIDQGPLKTAQTAEVESAQFEGPFNWTVTLQGNIHFRTSTKLPDICPQEKWQPDKTRCSLRKFLPQK